MAKRCPWVVLAAALAVACGSDDSGGGDPPVVPIAGTQAPVPGQSTAGAPGLTPTAGAGALPGQPPPTAGAPLAPTPTPSAGAPAGEDPAMAPAGDCAAQSLALDGMLHSPGGNVLPDGCLPFHPTTNNPYAVRCVDAWSWYTTPFPGDDFCILPPPAELGVQYGVHPQGKQWFAQVSTGDMSGYENVSTQWLMEAGEEEQANYHTGLDGPEFNYYRNYTRMRGGSHHMIVFSRDASAQQEIWQGGSPDFLATSFPGAQRPDENVPQSLDKPAEDAGLYSVMPSPTGITFNMHHFNATGGQILKEAWSNLWFEEDATIAVRPIFGLNFLQTAGLAVSPGSTQDLHYSWDIASPMRLVMIFGHRHAWTTSFSAWIEKPDGALDIVYQSFDWFDEPTYRYDSVVQNPVPDYQNKIDGASSGLRMLNPGETLHFNCHIEYTDARAASEGAPLPAENGTLRFANEAFTAEMCILFGSTTGGSLLNPASDSTPLPDFAMY